VSAQVDAPVERLFADDGVHAFAIGRRDLHGSRQRPCQLCHGVELSSDRWVASRDDRPDQLVLTVALTCHGFVVTCLDRSHISCLFSLGHPQHAFVPCHLGTISDVGLLPQELLSGPPDVHRLHVGNRVALVGTVTAEPDRNDDSRSHCYHQQDPSHCLAHVHSLDLHVRGTQSSGPSLLVYGPRRPGQRQQG
jgi:hypothetical protein